MRSNFGALVLIVVGILFLLSYLGMIPYRTPGLFFDNGGPSASLLRVS
jgi:hypothetical protein